MELILKPGLLWRDLTLSRRWITLCCG